MTCPGYVRANPDNWRQSAPQTPGKGAKNRDGCERDCLREAGAGGSNPLSPTTLFNTLRNIAKRRVRATVRATLRCCTSVREVFAPILTEIARLQEAV